MLMANEFDRLEQERTMDLSPAICPLQVLMSQTA